MAQNTASQNDLVKKVKTFIGEGVNHCPKIHTRVEENARYERGEQWSEGDVQRQAARERPAIPFNSIGKVVNALANREIIERYVPKAFGRSPEDAGVANALDEMCRWQRDQAMTEHSETMAIRRQVGSGWGVMHKYWDPSAADGAGMLRDEDVPIWNMLWPSRSREMNLSDRKWHVCGRWIPKTEAQARFFDNGRKAQNFFKGLDKKSVLAGNSSTSIDGINERHHGSMGVWGWGEVDRGFWTNQALDHIFVVESEWLEYEKSYRAAVPNLLSEAYAFFLGETDQLDTGQVDPQSQQPVILTQDMLKTIPLLQQRVIFKQLLQDSGVETFGDMSEINDISDMYEKMTGEELKDYRVVQRARTRYCVMTDSMIWEEGYRDYGYTYEFITGFPFEQRSSSDFYGVIDICKGPQDYKNAILSNILANYMTSPKGAVIIDEGLLPNIQEFTDKMSSPNAVISVPDGTTAAFEQRWRVLPPPTFQTMDSQLLQIAAGGVEEALALSSVDMGSQGDLRRVSGNVVQAAKTASNTIVAILFDGIRKFRKRYGLLNIKSLQYYYTPQEMLRVIGPEKGQDLQNIDSWDNVDRFDIKLDEEPVGVTERIDLIDFLTRNGTIDRWLQAGYITFDDMLDFLLPQMPESDKRSLKERRKTRDQQSQALQQCQQQLQEAQKMYALIQEYLQNTAKPLLDQWNVQIGIAQVYSQQLSAQQGQQQPPQQGQGA